MSTIQNIDLVLYGQQVTSISIPLGTTVQWNLTLEDQETRAPVDLSDKAVQLSWCSLDLRGFPVQPPIFSHEATPTVPLQGKCYVPQPSTDTAGDVPLSPGSYGVDVWLTDLDGNRIAMLAFVLVELTPASTLPTTPVTPVPGQPPLGLPAFLAHNIFHGNVELGTAGFHVVLDVGPLPNGTAGSFEAKVSVVDHANGKSGAWIALGTYSVNGSAVLSFPQGVQLDYAYLHTDLNSASVGMNIIPDGTNGILVEGNPGTYGTLRWSCLLLMSDAGNIP